MGGKHCKLFDENLVHNIMVSTGLSVLEYLKENGSAEAEEICEYLEMNASTIIENTIENLNRAEEQEQDEESDGDDESWLGEDEII